MRCLYNEGMTAAGAVIQISARGAQDAVLNADPSHTIWRAVHIRFTSSALDDELQELSSVAFNSVSTLIVNRYGDLITRIALEVTLPALAAPQIPVSPATTPPTYVSAADTGAHYVNCIGFAVFDEINIDIGGSTIDQLYSDYCFIYEELAGKPGLRLEEQIGRVQYSSEVDEDLLEKATMTQVMFVPLPLWISKFQPATWGLALPIVALSFHDVRFKMITRSIPECTAVIYKTGGAWKLADSTIVPLNAATGAPLANSDLGVRVLVTSVYLDGVERTAITAVTHSFLINVAKRQTLSIPANQATKVENKLFLNHPSSSLIWYARPLNWNTADGRRRFSCGYKDRFDFSSKVANSVTSVLPYGDCMDPILSASLSLNGHQRWPQDIASVYFRTSQPYTGWRTMPSTNIYTYAFALEAYSWQPTSTVNFSRLDHVSLGLTYAPGIQASELFAINESYNLLLVKDGLTSRP